MEDIMSNREKINNMAWEIVNELEPSYSYDVFDVGESQIIFQSEHGLKKVCLSCLGGNGSVKEQIKAKLRERE
jgi:hypothetical protein